jgi:hypothetical protein
MSASPSRPVRVVALLGLLLLVAAGLVLFLLARETGPPSEKPAPAEKPRAAASAKAPRAAPEEIETQLHRSRTAERPPETPAAEASEAPEATLDVEVLGPNGLPAAGADVALLNPLAQHLPESGGVEVARAKTDEDGRAQFVPGRRLVRVFAWRGAEAGASEKLDVGAESSRTVVRLEAAVPVKGRVVEAVGERPVGGVQVRFVARPWLGDEFGIALETTSANDGTFALPSLPLAGFEGQRAGSFAIEARAAAWPSARIEVTADLLRAGEVVVRLDRGAFLRGRILGPTSARGNAGYEIRLADGRATTTSQADGRFELPLPREGGPVVALTSTVTYGAGAARLLGRFRGDAGDIDLGDVTLSAGGRVAGTVVDVFGTAFKAATVSLSLEDVTVASVATDADGRFELSSVGDDPHELLAVEAPGENAWSGRRHATVQGVRGGASELRVVLTGALSVHVKFVAETDRSVVVVPEARLVAQETRGERRRYGWSWAGARIDSVRFDVERPGPHDVTIEIPGYESATISGVEVSAEQETPVEFVFRKKP